VGIVFLVAGVASLWSGSEISWRPGSHVAACTRNAGVFAGQRKGQLVVVELLAVGIQTIVAGQARRAISLNMFLHKRRIDLAVAIVTYSHIKETELLRVAILAAKRGPLGRLAVALQRVAGGLMGESAGVHDGQLGNCPSMIDVTPLTWKGFFHRLERAMEAGWVLKLGCDISVAGQAAIRHGFLAPRSCMAGGTTTSRLSMRQYPAQRRLANLGVKGSGTEQASAP
jgi:hypothetical protein